MFSKNRLRNQILISLTFLSFASCQLLTIPSASSSSSGTTSNVSVPGATNAKRGIAFDIPNATELSEISAQPGGVSWWYNWRIPSSTTYAGSLRNSVTTTYGVNYVPMIWNLTYTAATVEKYLKANPSIKYLLLINEPNLLDQANATPAQVAAGWPAFEKISADTGVKLVGPAMNYGNGANVNNPIQWLDQFYTAYWNSNGHAPQVDAIAFHWYDYGLQSWATAIEAGTISANATGQTAANPHGLPPGKNIWVTEFANWNSNITTLAGQESQMQSMVSWLESTPWIIRYAWFTGYMSPDPHYSSLFTSSGALSALGQYYISLPLGR